MLQVATGKISLKSFRDIIESGNSAQANFSAPSHGLFLIGITYGENVMFKLKWISEIEFFEDYLMEGSHPQKASVARDQRVEFVHKSLTKFI